MGLLRRIEQKLPWEWDKAAKEMRIKRELCLRLYRNIPAYFKGNKLRDASVRYRAYKYIDNIFKDDVQYRVDISGSDPKMWRELSERITQIKEECR